MNYNILLTKNARKFILSQPKNRQVQLLNAINKLPSFGDINTVKGKNATFRLRVGDYRVIYTLHENVITVTVIGNRGQVYNEL